MISILEPMWREELGELEAWTPRSFESIQNLEHSGTKLSTNVWRARCQIMLASVARTIDPRQMFLILHPVERDERSHPDRLPGQTCSGIIINNRAPPASPSVHGRPRLPTTTQWEWCSVFVVDLYIICTCDMYITYSCHVYRETWRKIDAGKRPGRRSWPFAADTGGAQGALVSLVTSADQIHQDSHDIGAVEVLAHPQTIQDLVGGLSL